MTIAIGVTTENNGHTHTISNPDSGYTDFAPDGHHHALIKGCAACQKIRATLHVAIVPTSFRNGHIHFLNSASLVKR